MLFKLKNAKKILIVTSEFPPQPGGIGNHACNLASYLHQNGFKVDVQADIRSNDGKEEQVFDSGLPFKVNRITRNKFIVFTYLQRILRFSVLARKNGIIIASGKFPLWLVGLTPFVKKVKKYAVIHGSEVNLQGFNKKLTDKALKNFNKIVAVSNFTKSLVQHLELKNIEVIPNGFKLAHYNDEKFEKKIKGKETLTLITVGNVTERKGQLNVIRALPKLKKVYPDIKYHVVGIPTEQLAFEKAAIVLGVEDCIHFHGKVTDEKKYKLLQESDIFVMLSNSTEKGDVEGFGIAIIEANALGLPAIGSIHTGIADAIKDGNSGRLVSAKNIEDFVESTVEICSNYQSYSKQASSWSKQFKWSIIIQKYLAIFNK